MTKRWKPLARSRGQRTDKSWCKQDYGGKDCSKRKVSSRVKLMRTAGKWRSRISSRAKWWGRHHCPWTRPTYTYIIDRVQVLFTDPEDVLDTHFRVVQTSPSWSELVPERILAVPARCVDPDVPEVMTACPAQGSRRLARVALVDDEMHVASVTSGEVGLQLCKCVALRVAGLKRTELGRWDSLHQTELYFTMNLLTSAFEDGILWNQLYTAYIRNFTRTLSRFNGRFIYIYISPKYATYTKFSLSTPCSAQQMALF